MSMSKWINNYSCPGYMVVPRKPCTFCNEYHTICFCETGILYRMELVEGKDPPTRISKEYNDMGKTVGLFLRMTKLIHGTGNVVVMDSGFCVLQAVIEFKKVGVFSSSLIKKRRYWPIHIDGEMVKAYIQDKDPGYEDARRGEYGKIPFYIYCMKEPDYFLMFMTTFGTMSRIGKEQVSKLDENGKD